MRLVVSWMLRGASLRVARSTSSAFLRATSLPLSPMTTWAWLFFSIDRNSATFLTALGVHLSGQFREVLVVSFDGRLHQVLYHLDSSYGWIHDLAVRSVNYCCGWQFDLEAEGSSGYSGEDWLVEPPVRDGACVLQFSGGACDGDCR